ncbi:MAG: glycosyltransferase family 2 protein [Clostridia bacterium]|nr:glycosyltransferase family 2 protein [Clostridia bacterium]
MDALISIIVPVYNVAEYLPRCMDSILEQTYTNLEVILIDDGSTDGSDAICNAYAEKDGRVRVVHQENGGVGRARNAGLAHCTGDYIAFVDSDDYIFPDSIRQLYDRAQADGSDMVIGNCVRTYQDGTQSDPCFALDDAVYTRDEILNRLTGLTAMPVVSWNKLLTRHCMEGVKYPEVCIGEDTRAFPKMLDHCTRISTISTSTYAYFQRGDSLMRSMKSEKAKSEDVYALLCIARYLWDNHRYDNATNWYTVAVKNALTIRNHRDRLAKFRQTFNHRSRIDLFKRMNPKGKLAWLCLHIPLVNRLFCLLFSKNIKKA